MFSQRFCTAICGIESLEPRRSETITAIVGIRVSGGEVHFGMSLKFIEGDVNMGEISQFPKFGRVQ